MLKTMQQIKGSLEVVNKIFLLLQLQQHSWTKLLDAPPFKWILFLLSEMKCVRGDPPHHPSSTQKPLGQGNKSKTTASRSPKQERAVSPCGKPHHVGCVAQKTGADKCLQQVRVAPQPDHFILSPILCLLSYACSEFPYLSNVLFCSG